MLPRLTIASIDEAEDLLRARTPFHHVLSFGDPTSSPPDGFADHAARKLRIEFDDIEREPTGGSWYVAVTREQVVATLAFLRGCDGPTLIHCAAGVSRSAAAGLLLLALHLPPDEAVAELRRIRPIAWPNRRMIGFGDTLLGLDGRLIAADKRWRTIQDCGGIPGYEVG